jgi:hypothetical protein
MAMIIRRSGFDLTQTADGGSAQFLAAPGEVTSQESGHGEGDAGRQGEPRP